MSFIRVLSTIGFAWLLAWNSFAQAEEVVHSGDLKAKFSGAVSGNWSIVKEGDSHFIVLDENFSARSGPDVKLFLSKKEAKLISGRDTPTKRTFVSLLKSFEGSERYEIPKGIDLKDYKAIFFLCEAYSKLWGTGEF